jgi:hypothetical protein
MVRHTQAHVGILVGLSKQNITRILRQKRMNVRFFIAEQYYGATHIRRCSLNRVYLYSVDLHTREQPAHSALPHLQHTARAQQFAVAHYAKGRTTVQLTCCSLVPGSPERPDRS